MGADRTVKKIMVELNNAAADYAAATTFNEELLPLKTMRNEAMKLKTRIKEILWT